MKIKPVEIKNDSFDSIDDNHDVYTLRDLVRAVNELIEVHNEEQEYSLREARLLERIEKEVIGEDHCSAHIRYVEPGFCSYCDTRKNIITEQRKALSELKGGKE